MLRLGSLNYNQLFSELQPTYYVMCLLTSNLSKKIKTELSLQKTLDFGLGTSYKVKVL